MSLGGALGTVTAVGGAWRGPPVEPKNSSNRERKTAGGGAVTGWSVLVAETVIIGERGRCESGGDGGRYKTFLCATCTVPLTFYMAQEGVQDLSGEVQRRTARFGVHISMDQ